MAFFVQNFRIRSFSRILNQEKAILSRVLSFKIKDVTISKLIK